MGEGLANRVSAAVAACNGAHCICAGALQSFVQKGIQRVGAAHSDCAADSAGSGCWRQLCRNLRLYPRDFHVSSKEIPRRCAPTRKISFHGVQRDLPRLDGGSRAGGENLLRNSGQVTL